MKLISSGDWHLSNSYTFGTINRDGINTFLLKVYDAFITMINDAIKYKAVLCICGDLFDAVSLDPVTLKIFHKILKHIIKNKVETIILNGNHEYDGIRSAIESYSEWSGETEWNNIHFIFKPTIFKLHHTWFYVLPYMGKSSDQQYDTVITFISSADKYKGEKILLMHYPIVGCRFDSHSINLSKGFNLAQVLKTYGNPFTYIFSGDFHDRQQLPGVDNFLYVGQPFHSDFSSIENKRGYTLFDTHTEKLKLISIDCPSPVIINIKRLSDIRGDFNNKIVRAMVREGIDKSIVHDELYKLGALKVQVKTIKKQSKIDSVKTTVAAEYSGVDHNAIITKFTDAMWSDKHKFSKKKLLKTGLNLYNEVSRRVE